MAKRRSKGGPARAHRKRGRTTKRARRSRVRRFLSDRALQAASLLLLVSAFHVQGDIKVWLSAGKQFSGTVTHVVDGDSILVSGIEPQVRLWGVDAPEADDASTQVLRRVALGRPVDCFTMDKDHYGRIIARCSTRAGDDINLTMIASDTAREYFEFTGGYYARQLAFQRGGAKSKGHAAEEADPTPTAPRLPSLVEVSDPRPFSGRVERVIDGDTFYISGVRIRLLKVDAPELDTVEGKWAKEKLTRLVHNRWLECENFGDDKYGRTLARCSLEDGADVGQMMIDSIFAGEF